MTRSFELHPVRNRQSYQTTYTFPLLSRSAVGMSRARTPPAGTCTKIGEIEKGPANAWPPSVDTNDSILVRDPFAMGTMTSPSGWTSGWPWSTDEPVGTCEGDQVPPPSVDRAMWIWLKCPKSSNST